MEEQKKETSFTQQLSDFLDKKSQERDWELNKIQVIKLALWNVLAFAFIFGNIEGYINQNFLEYAISWVFLIILMFWFVHDWMRLNEENVYKVGRI